MLTKACACARAAMSSSKERTKKYRERLKENEEKYEIVSILLIKGWDVIFFPLLG